MSNLIIFFAI